MDTILYKFVFLKTFKRFLRITSKSNHFSSYAWSLGNSRILSTVPR